MYITHLLSQHTAQCKDDAGEGGDNAPNAHEYDYFFIYFHCIPHIASAKRAHTIAAHTHPRTTNSIASSPTCTEHLWIIFDLPAKLDESAINENLPVVFQPVVSRQLCNQEGRACWQFPVLATPFGQLYHITYLHSIPRSVKMMQARAVIMPPTLTNTIIFSSTFTYYLQPSFGFPVHFA